MGPPDPKQRNGTLPGIAVPAKSTSTATAAPPNAKPAARGIIDEPSTEEVTDSMFIGTEGTEGEGSAIRARRVPAPRPLGKDKPAVKPAAPPPTKEEPPKPKVEPVRPAARPEITTASDLRAGSSVRASFSGYELLVPMARGGMAAVWAARARGSFGFQRIVALKTLLPEVSDNPDFQAMFLDEARIASRIRHPNVVDILDFGGDGDLLFIAMEWVEGDTLGALRKASRAIGGIPLPITLRIVRDVCSGLHAAHELRDDRGLTLDLVHRDVSPQNVMVSALGHVKLVDFGIAKSKARIYWTSDGNMLKGKASYLSPEQVAGLPVDRRSDVFALGTMLYSLTTGLHPFRGQGELETAANVTSMTPPPPSSLVKSMDPALEKIILRALQKEPAERFSTALELQHALEGVIAGIGIPASAATVAAFVRELIGAKLTKRAAKLHATIVAFDEAEAIVQDAAHMDPRARAGIAAAAEGAEELWKLDEDEVTIQNVLFATGESHPPPAERVAPVAPVIAPAAKVEDPANVVSPWVGANPSAVVDPATDGDLPLLAANRSRRRAPLALAAAALVGIGALLVWGTKPTAPVPQPRETRTVVSPAPTPTMTPAPAAAESAPEVVPEPVAAETPPAEPARTAVAAPRWRPPPPPVRPAAPRAAPRPAPVETSPPAKAPTEPQKPEKYKPTEI